MTRPVSAWMPLYVGDYLGDTQRLTTEQHGAYLLLILDYWRNGPAPDDDAVLQQITKCDAKTWKKHRPAMARLFQVADGEWRHKRVDRERATAEDRSERGKAGSDAKWGASETAERGKHLRSQRLSEARRKGTHTPSQWESLKAFCGCCVRCGADGEMVKDHITPIYQGGSDGIDNIQPLCRPCNSSKGPEATDHRPDGWQNACGAGVKRPQNATTSQSQSPQKNSDTDVSGAAAPPKLIDPEKVMFDQGRALLAEAGIVNGKAGTLLGKWKRDHGAEAVIVALGKAQREGAIDPISFIEGCFRNGKRHQHDGSGGWAPRPGMEGVEPASLDDEQFGFVARR